MAWRITEQRQSRGDPDVLAWAAFILLKIGVFVALVQLLNLMFPAVATTLVDADDIDPRAGTAFLVVFILPWAASRLFNFARRLF